MKNIFAFLTLAVLLPISQVHAAGPVKLSEMARTNDIAANDLFEMSRRVGAAYVTRAITGSNVMRMMTNVATANGGIFYDGVNLTNIPQSGVNGLVADLQSIEDDIAAIIVFSGSRIIDTNATTQEWQDALDAGGEIWVSPNQTYTITNNLRMTNAFGTVIKGNGSTVIMGNGLTNFLFDTGLESRGAIFIQNLNFYGGQTNVFNDAAYFSTLNNSPDPYYNADWTNRTGLRVSSSSGGALMNCTFWGFGGAGFLVVNTNSLAAYLKPRIEIFANTCVSNFIGAFIVGASYHTAGYYNNPEGGWTLATAEYTRVSGCTFAQNTIGLVAPAGNAQVMHSFLTGNYIGLFVGSAPNAAHGNYSYNNLNHNVIGLWAESNNGGIFAGSTFLANTTYDVLFNGVTQFKLQGNWFTKPLIVTNSSAGSIRFNEYEAHWATNGWNINAGVKVEGNISSTIAGDDDGSYYWQTNAARASSIKTLHNVTVLGDFTTTTIRATNLVFGTNQASDASIDFTKKRSLLATNDAVTYTGCILPAGWETNALSNVTTITNTSATPFPVVFDASFQRIPGGLGNTVYCTNVLKIGASTQLGEGTNFWAVGR